MTKTRTAIALLALALGSAGCGGSHPMPAAPSPVPQPAPQPAPTPGVFSLVDVTLSGVVSEMTPTGTSNSFGADIGCAKSVSRRIPRAFKFPRPFPAT